MISRSTSASSPQTTTTNNQLAFDDIDGIAVSNGNVNVLDAGAINSAREIASDALLTTRATFSDALDFADNVVGADSQNLKTLVSATRADSVALGGTISKTVGVVVLVVGVIFVINLLANGSKK